MKSSILEMKHSKEEQEKRNPLFLGAIRQNFFFSPERIAFLLHYFPRCIVPMTIPIGLYYQYTILIPHLKALIFFSFFISSSVAVDERHCYGQFVDRHKNWSVLSKKKRRMIENNRKERIKSIDLTRIHRGGFSQ